MFDKPWKKHVVNSDKERMYIHTLMNMFIDTLQSIGDIILSKDYLKFN